MAKAGIFDNERRHREQSYSGEMPNAEAVIRALGGITPECIKVVAPDGRLLSMNPVGLLMVEAGSWEEVQGVAAFDLIAPEHRQTWRENHKRVCRGENLTWSFDIEGLRGTRRPVETHAAPITLADGAVGQLAITRDLSAPSETARGLEEINESLERQVRERTRALEATLTRLQESERSFELLVGSVTDYAIYMLDPDGNIVSWNTGAERIKGYTVGEIIGRNFSCFYTDEDRSIGLPGLGLRIAAQEGRFEAEGWRVRKDGSRFVANVIIDAIRQGGQLVGFAKITRDITEKKAAESQLREAQKMEAVGQFTGGAAHDFNNLLTAILGSLEILRKRLPADPRLLALLDNAVQGAKRGASLTQRMLAFARRQELKPEAVGLANLVAGMKELIERLIGPMVTVDVRIPRGISAVLTDPNQLETALLNLIVNARDAMPSGGTITITAHQEHLEVGNFAGLTFGLYVCLSVVDTGYGMDGATLARVTEPFFTTKGVGKGTGLGLSMVDGLAAQSGGKLRLGSRMGEGTTVELWLPVAVGDARAPEVVRSRPIDRAQDPLVILAVDDDSLVLMNTIAMLEDLGHQVIDVTSGAKALEAIEADPGINLVVSDQAMPGMTGMQLIEQIRRRRPELPVVLATGYAELPTPADPSIGRLAKPFSQKDLADAVAAATR